MRVRLKGVASATYNAADGTKRRYWYAWRGGPKLEGVPGSPEFMASYNAAIAGRKQVPIGTLASLCALYKASREFTGKAAKTRKDYLRYIGLIETKFGTMPIAAVQDRRARGVFKAWRDEIATASGERTADYAWAVLARVLSVAKDRGHIATNPCERGGRLSKGSRKDSVWSDLDEATFITRGPEHLHLPLLLALWTGQRQADLLALTWMQYDGRHIRLEQSKTKRRVTIPVGAPLKAALDALREFDGNILLTSDGTPWTSVAVAGDRLQTAAVGGSDGDGDAGAHAPDSHTADSAGIPLRIQPSEFIH
jgi:integrase